MALKYLDQADVQGKIVLARFDLNAPLTKNEGPKKLSDSFRVDIILPTVKNLLERGAKKVILMSHLGRPKGKINPEFSLEPVATYIAEQLNEEVYLTETCKDSGIKTLLTLGNPKIILLENLRFHPEEEENNREFAETLSEYGDIYVNDAFGALHRKHASVHDIIHFFPQSSYCGPLIKKEIESIKKMTEHPEKPFVAVLGGAKVKDKIKTISKLLPMLDQLLIGGAMAYPFMKAKGQSIGNSLCDDTDFELAKKILMEDRGKKIITPVDHIVAPSIEGDHLTVTEIKNDMMGFDIGPETIELYQSYLVKAKTVFWNGPMGLFEKEQFAQGTFAIAKILANDVPGFTIVGGGDSVSAIKKSGFSNGIDHISSGGGASLEYIENGTLPGIEALRFGID
jgi:phosphoglycerate kinase